MRNKQISLLIGTSALAILALIGFQLSWMRHSRALIEEQFNNRVNMALCSTVERMAENQVCSQQIRECCKIGSSGTENTCVPTLELISTMPETKKMLAEVLHYYQIDLPYNMMITPKDTNTCEGMPPFSCSLNPVLESDTHILQLQFQGKTGYLLQRLGLMAFASIAILLLVCVVFALGSYYLLRQQKMSALNRDFFNHMTHEFRTPLTNIKLAGNLLVRKHPELKDSPYLGIIQQESRQLMGHVEDVLHLAALEKGDYRLKKESLDLGEMLHGVVQSMDLQIREKSAEVIWEGSTSPGRIQGDAFHLANAFRNLLDNALKYSGEHPQIRIGLYPEATGYRIRFQDNGPGMTSQECQQVFGKFQRAADACAGGFGLGLTYVKKIIDMHRGNVQLQSEKGRGACFNLYLPVA